MRKLRAFRKDWKDHFGNPLEDFFNDPRPKMIDDGYGDGESNHIEDRIERCFANQGRLIALLIEKGLFTVEDGLEVTQITNHVSQYEIREVTE